MNYQSEYQKSITEPEEFWKSKAENIKWFEFPKTILSKNDKGFYRWFEGGKLNTSYLALDFHVENGRGNQVAVYYDSPVTNIKEEITYQQLLNRVSQFAGVLTKQGIKKGDTVVIYLPMIPEAVVSMLACARIGAIHSVVFGGFAPHELAVRIDDAKPKVIVTASCGIEIDKVIPYKELVDQAIEEAKETVSTVIVKERSQYPADIVSMTSGRDFWFDELMSKANPVEALPVDATDPLYILYTSGTTGKPKGIVRDHGGHAVALKYSMDTIYDAKPGEVYWAASDVGWVVGHSYIVYAPLIQGCSTILYEGKPVKTPDAGALWRVMEEYQVNVFFTAPTAFRAVKKEDPEATLKNNYDLSSLKYVFQAGERLDPPTYEWLEKQLGVPIIDNWWQTETGWPIVSNPAGLNLFPPKIGSATFPSPGFQLTVMDETGTEVPRGESGFITAKLPLPPSCFPTLWNNDERFKAGYLSFKEGYYLSGDGGYIDEDGYVFIMGRVDDVINVAGHRFSTGEMEEIIGSHSAVAECAVIGIDDDLKGQNPIGLCILKDGQTIDEELLEKEVCQLIRDKVGAVASFKTNLLVKRLPKTRSGKILRKTIRQLAAEENIPTPPTIDDPAILDEIREKFKNRKVGKIYS